MTDELDAPLGQKKKNGDKPKRKLGFALPKIGMPSLTALHPRSWPIARILFVLIRGHPCLSPMPALPLRGPARRPPLGHCRHLVLAQFQRGGQQRRQHTGRYATGRCHAGIVADTTPTGTGPQITTLDPNLPESDPTPVGIRALTEFGVDPDLIEETPNGPIPQMGGAGKTTFATYSRASIGPASADGKALIAIVVTGLGLSESGTLDAIAKLPDNVTLAFAPYGRSLQRTTAAARAEGHEMLLQIPDGTVRLPGQRSRPANAADRPDAPRQSRQALLVDGPLRRLFRVINYMGARYSASAADSSP